MLYWEECHWPDSEHKYYGATITENDDYGIRGEEVVWYKHKYDKKNQNSNICIDQSGAHYVSDWSLLDFSYHLETFQRIDIEVWMHRQFVQFRQVQVCTDPLRPPSTSKLNSKWIVNDGSKWKKMKSESDFSLGRG